MVMWLKLLGGARKWSGETGTMEVRSQRMNTDTLEQWPQLHVPQSLELLHLTIVLTIDNVQAWSWVK